jgi:hypothetical protein
MRIQIDEAGNTYVLDTVNGRVAVFGKQGEYLLNLVLPDAEMNEFYDLAARQGVVAVYGTRGKDLGVHVFDMSDTQTTYRYILGGSRCAVGSNARSVFVDSQGNVITCVFDMGWEGDNVGGTILQHSRSGHTDEFYVGPFWSIAAGWDGLLYISRLGCSDDEGLEGHCVFKFDPDGALLDEIPIPKSALMDAGISAFGHLGAVDREGRLYGHSGWYEDEDQPAMSVISPNGKHMLMVVLRRFVPMFEPLVIDGAGRWHVPVQLKSDREQTETFRVSICPLANHLQD